MADESMYGTMEFTEVVRLGGDIRESDYCYRILSVGGNTAKPGMVVTTNGESDNYVDLAVTTDESFLGIIVEVVPKIDDDYDVDDAITDGLTVKILRPTGGRAEIAVFLEPDSTTDSGIKEGDQIALGTEAGKVRKWVHSAGTTTHTNDMATDTMAEVVGTAAQSHAGHATDDKILIIRY